ncbi:DMT family transporter [Massilia sp. CFBP9012]|uniref:DMT family transporter n=1 Tax=Massilia sp. CFBP9012 TaxID=3096531 RepID=UPI002A6B26F3|nr:DMT family transporter [Massilia sp. CFBP9012]MDY0974097.1 DMT family transporter [Massilia sp. CFBP9012]
MTARGRNLYSIYAMLLAVFMFALMDTAMKLLAARYPALQVAALRAICSLPLIAVYVAWRGAFAGIFQVRWPMHFLRGVLGILMLALFAFGLKKLSLAEAYSIFFIAPALITALSVLLLKERVNLARWVAIAVGLGGVLVVLRPSGAGFLTIGGLAVLGAAACYAVSAITVRVLARSDRSEHTVFWLIVMIAAGAGLLAAPGWVLIPASEIPLLCGLAVSGFIGQLAITEAFSRGEASSVAPFEYSALAWGVGLDWLLWRALPDGWTLAGAAIIIGSGLYLIRHEKDHVEAEHP